MRLQTGKFFPFCSCPFDDVNSLRFDQGGLVSPEPDLCLKKKRFCFLTTSCKNHLWHFLLFCVAEGGVAEVWIACAA